MAGPEVRLRRLAPERDARSLFAALDHDSVWIHVAPRLEVRATGYTPAVWASAVNPATKLLVLGLDVDRLHAGRVQLRTDVCNLRSQRAVLRLGATGEGVLRRHRLRADGTVRDTVTCSVTAEQWPEVRRGLQDRLVTAR